MPIGGVANVLKEPCGLIARLPMRTPLPIRTPIAVVTPMPTSVRPLLAWVAGVGDGVSGGAGVAGGEAVRKRVGVGVGTPDGAIPAYAAAPYSAGASLRPGIRR